MFYAWFQASMDGVAVEDTTNRGRLDMAVVTDGAAFLFEFKVAARAAPAARPASADRRDAAESPGTDRGDAAQTAGADRGDAAQTAGADRGDAALYRGRRLEETRRRPRAEPPGRRARAAATRRSTARPWRS